MVTCWWRNWSIFFSRKKNLRFKLALNGVNPFWHNNTQYSTQLILLVIFNLPLYQVIKNFFVQLCILISSKDFPTNENIDVFLCPLVDDLKLLWDGIQAQDFSQPAGERRFKLRGILFWTILDYPAYKLISRLYTHGYKACVVFGPQIKSRSAKLGNKLNSKQKARDNKIIFLGARSWTCRGHPYWNSLEFNGRIEKHLAPAHMIGEEATQYVEERISFL